MKEKENEKEICYTNEKAFIYDESSLKHHPAPYLGSRYVHVCRWLARTSRNTKKRVPKNTLEYIYTEFLTGMYHFVQNRPCY